VYAKLIFCTCSIAVAVLSSFATIILPTNTHQSTISSGKLGKEELSASDKL